MGHRIGKIQHQVQAVNGNKSTCVGSLRDKMYHTQPRSRGAGQQDRKLDFPTINNEAEYEALIAGLGLAGTLRVKNFKVYGDLKLVISQVKGEFKVIYETMAKYVRLVWVVVTQFDECHVEHIPREENAKADTI
ncbi:uncharacterized protein LOC141699847 [Apium graveolens]|uniref:uncharacterized protein LOC141699847 n=1 Tax=Apium graveolens TaxID=4045 RepID=UPI003D7BBBC8